MIDPVVAGVKIAESLVGMKKGHSKLRKFHAPPQRLEDYEGTDWRHRFPPGANSIQLITNLLHVPSDTIEKLALSIDPMVKDVGARWNFCAQQ